MNLSKYKVIENKWARAIETGKNVKVELNIKYVDSELRPSSFEIKYSIDGEITITNITN